MSAIVQQLMSYGNSQSQTQTNFTWNSADKSSGITLSSGDLVATGSASFNQNVRGTKSKSTGKWYFEVTRTSGSDVSFNVVGIVVAGYDINGTGVGIDPGGYGYGYTGHWYPNGGASSSDFASIPTGSVWGFAVDLSGNRLYLAKNNAWQESADPVAGTNGKVISAGTYFPACTSRTNVMTINQTLVYAPPSGYTPWQ